MVDETPATTGDEVTPSESGTEIQDPQEEQPPTAEPSYENLYREEKRKLEAIQERMDRLEENVIPRQPYTVPTYPAQQAPNADPKKEIEELANRGKPYIREVAMEVVRQERLKDAVAYAASKGFTTKEIDRIIAQYGLSIDDPMRAVNTAIKLSGKQAPKPTVSKADTVVDRKEKINQTSTAPATPKQTPKVSKDDEVASAYKEACEEGTDKSLFKFFRKGLD